MRKLSCYFHPSTVVVVDDNMNFLNTFRHVLPDNFLYKPFAKPQDALQFLDNQWKVSSTDPLWENIDNLNKELDVDCSNGVIINYHQILNRAKYANRSQTVSVVVIDYAMPAMNGIDFCQALSHLPCKKLLITGLAGHATAVSAFNSKLIDYFILKEDPLFLEQSRHTINQLSQDFFVDSSSTLLQLLCTLSDCCLKYHPVQQIIRNYWQAHHITEAYLVDTHGSFLNIDADGNSSVFALCHESVLRRFADIIANSGGPSWLFEKLNHRQQLPFFFEQECLNPYQWWPYFHPAHLINTEQNAVYYSIISHLDNYPLLNTIPKAYNAMF